MHFNGNRGIYGTSRKIGILETTGRDCGIWEEHEAFQYAQFNYLHQPASQCSSNTACQVVGGNIIDNGLTRGGRCVDEHATQVASRISSSQGGEPLHAAEVQFYVANEGNPDDLLSYINALNWLKEEGVKIVNESWGGGPTYYAAIDVARDYYANKYGMTFVKASGGTTSADCYNNRTYPNCAHLCQSGNALCVGTANRGGSTLNPSYTDYSDDTSWSGSWFLNYDKAIDPENEIVWDVERPDVVSDGVQAYAADVQSGDDEKWTTVTGSSFSTPVITGLLALENEYCGTSEPLFHTAHRAIFRQTAYNDQELEPDHYPAHPIGGQNYFSQYDFAGGTGIPWSRHLVGESNVDARTPICTGNGGLNFVDAPEWMETSPPNDSSIVQHEDWSTVSQPLRVPDGMVVAKAWEIESPEAGTKIRANLSFTTCAPGGSASKYENASDYLLPSVDFDLLLCSEEEEGCVIASESAYDVNEGFFVKLENDHPDLNLYIMRPKETGCEQPATGAFSWRAAWWR